MNRLWGILAMVAVLYGILMISDEGARSAENHVNLARRTGFFGVLTLGAGLLIIAGGIDLSVGSVVGLSAVSLGLMLEKRVPPALAVTLVLTGSLFIGLFHGLLVTKLRLQPFIVTLCGLFIYRGIARTLTQTTVGLRVTPETLLGPPAAELAPAELVQRLESLRPTAVELQQKADWLADVLVRGQPLFVPNVLVVLLVLTALLAVMLHASTSGRHLFAVGANEQAA